MPGEVNLLGQRGVRPVPGRVGLAQLLLDPGQGFPQRLDQVLDGRAAQLQLARRGRVRRPQPALGDLEEPRRARVQRLRGQRLEPLGQLIFDQRGPLGRAALDHPGPVLGGPGSLSAAANRPRANRYPIAAPMRIPSSSPTSNKTAPICSDDLTVSAKPGADTPRAPTDRGKAPRANGAMRNRPIRPGNHRRPAGRYVHAAGVRHVFGYPGESILDFMEAARHRGVQVVSAVREGTAAFMAEAAAMTSGRPGVCLSTLRTGVDGGAERGGLGHLGPGAHARDLRADRSSREQFFTHQVVDHDRMFAPVSKLALRLDPASADTVIRKALRTAVAERPVLT